MCVCTCDLQSLHLCLSVLKAQLIFFSPSFYHIEPYRIVDIDHFTCKKSSFKWFNLMYFLLSSNPQITIISFDFFLLALVYTSHGIIDVLM